MARIRPSRLAPFNRRFVAEYVRDCNATQAYIRAGGGSDRASWDAGELLRDPAIRRAIDTQLARVAEACELTQERITRELMAIAFADVTDIWTTDPEDGSTVIDLDVLTDDQRKAIQSISYSPSTGAVSVKMHDKMRALTILAERYGLFDPPQPVTTITIEADDIESATRLYQQAIEARKR